LEIKRTKRASNPEKKTMLPDGKRLHIFLRSILGIIFIVASINKIYDPKGFALIIQNYKILPPEMINFVAVTLPWLEAVCGFLLLTGCFVKGSALILDILLLIFIIALLINYNRGIDISCGCFSLSSDGTKSIFHYIIRDLILLGLGIVVLFYRPGIRLQR